MNFPSRETVEKLRREYPPGTRVELLEMNDSQSPPKGTLGLVQGTDDVGSILMKWDNGSSLSLIPETDTFRKVGENEHTFSNNRHNI